MAARHKSAVRQHRRSLVNNARNRQHVTRLRGQLKAIRKLIADKQVEEARKALVPTLSLLDHSVTKGVLHRNAASRTKSRIQLQVNKLA